MIMKIFSHISELVIDKETGDSKEEAGKAVDVLQEYKFDKNHMSSRKKRIPTRRRAQSITPSLRQRRL